MSQICGLWLNNAAALATEAICLSVAIQFTQNFLGVEPECSQVCKFVKKFRPELFGVCSARVKVSCELVQVAAHPAALGKQGGNSGQGMLKNRRYIGELKFRDVVVPDAIPPIVPLELFDDVQEKIAKNKKAPARRKAEDDYLLTTKLHCGCCGALMFGESGTSRTGEVHRYYKCATAKKHKGCKKKTVRKQWLEDLVVNQTMQLVRDDAAMESIIAKVMELQDRENTNLPLYEKQLRDAEAGIQNMLNAIQAGILTSSTKERLEQLEETKRELEARIAEEKLAKPKVTEEFIRFWLLRFRKLDMSLKDQRQALVDTFINAIYLYDDMFFH